VVLTSLASGELEECLNELLELMLIRLGYSKKGWTDGEIGVLVDGHNSHYTQAFLEYATAHRIHVLCYPAHGTHVYQGLDVVVFGILKLYFWRSMGQPISRHSPPKQSRWRSKRQESFL